MHVQGQQDLVRDGFCSVILMFGSSEPPILGDVVRFRYCPSGNGARVYMVIRSSATEDVHRDISGKVARISPLFDFGYHCKKIFLICIQACGHVGSNFP